jgi:hypothetical protein
MVLKYKREAIDETAALYQLIRAHARNTQSAVASLTDSSGGAASTTTVVAASTSLANAANSGTNLAQKAASEAILVTVVDAMRELYVKANEYATNLGLPTVTYSGGGAATDGTIAAISVATTAAATGIQATETNAILTVLNTDFYILTALVNKIANAMGLSQLTNLTGQTYAATVASISTSAGTAADPGVTATAFNAEAVKLRNNVATLATKINTFNDGVGSTALVVIG